MPVLVPAGGVETVGEGVAELVSPVEARVVGPQLGLFAAEGPGPDWRRR
jgi:hypothetical protein